MNRGRRMNGWLKRLLFVGVGAAAGYAYYYFIGCVTGACPITSNPYVSSVYGALLGIVLGWGKEHAKARNPESGKS